MFILLISLHNCYVLMKLFMWLGKLLQGEIKMHINISVALGIL